MDLWEKVIPVFKYDPEVPFFDMLVPTMDTVRFGYLMEKLLAVNRSVLFTGTTGVGKVSQFIQEFIAFVLYIQEVEIILVLQLRYCY